MVEDQIKLLEEQKKLHAELKLDVVGMPLFDTVVVVCSIKAACETLFLTKLVTSILPCNVGRDAIRHLV